MDAGYARPRGSKVGGKGGCGSACVCGMYSQLCPTTVQRWVWKCTGCKNAWAVSRVGLNFTYARMYGVCVASASGKFAKSRSCKVTVYESGQPLV